MLKVQGFEKAQGTAGAGAGAPPANSLSGMVGSSASSSSAAAAPASAMDALEHAALRAGEKRKLESYGDDEDEGEDVRKESRMDADEIDI
jgi:hypothetical protein